MNLLDSLGFDRDTDYGFGAEFDYTSWDEHTELMLTNVPINTDYRDIVQMDGGMTAWNAWLDAQPNHKYTNASLQKFNEGIVKIDLPINQAMKFNYLRARNGANPVGDTQRDYFYFITGIRYGAPETTYVSLQLDVITTFLPEITFGYSYVERGHIGVANTKQFNSYGREYLTVPEGIDLGGEYRTVHVEFDQVMSPVDTDSSDVTLGYDVLVCATLDLTQDPGTIQNPSQKASTGGTFQGLPSGASFYIFPTGYDLGTFFLDYTDKSWITESIISITLIPNMKRYIPNYNYGPNISPNPTAYKFYKAQSDFPQKFTKKMLTNWRNNLFIQHILGSAYGNLKKFLTYPYMVIEMTGFNGSSLIIKPEAWQDPDATLVEMAALVPPGQRVVGMPLKYNWDPETATGTQPADQYDQFNSFDDFGEFLDFAVPLSDFPQLPVVNNATAAFLAQNKNGIAFQFRSADWTQQRALSGAQASYDVQNAQIGNTARQSSIGNQANTDTTSANANAQTLNSIIGAAGSIPDMAGGAAGAAAKMGGKRAGSPGFGVQAGRAAAGVQQEAAGGIGSAAAGMGQAYVSATTALQTAQIANNARSQSAISDIQTAGSVRDTNNAYATMAAKGDYANAIAGVQAKLQDANMMQPSVSGQFGGDAFNLINGKFGFALRWKMVNLNALRTLGNYWLRYGYAINQFIPMPTSLHCMTKFTYWKLSESYISQGAFPEGFKQIIRGVFEKGVTVWKNPDDIGRTALSDNQPLGGISY